MEKIAIFGGTFNPIHKGHLHLVSAYQKRLSFDRILLIPTSIPPHKQVEELASDADRLAMCRLAAADYPFLEVSDIELKRHTKSYTFDTLMLLREQFPQARFYLIMGSDMFMTFRDWYRAAEMIPMVTVLTAARETENLAALEQERQKLEALGGQAMILDLPVWEISSTEIRRRIKTSENLSELLDDSVIAYIQENGLYQQRED